MSRAVSTTDLDDIEAKARAAGITGITGKALFEACMAERLLNDFRGWDRRETVEYLNGARWDGVVAGLKEKEKARWNAAARRLAARVLADRSGEKGEPVRPLPSGEP